MRKNIYFVISALLIMLFYALFTSKLDKNNIVSSGVDSWEYHSVAVNFAKYNKFPLMGVYKTDSIYQFDRFKSSKIEDYLFCRWHKSGTVYSFEKPPLYSLSLGLFYKFFGIDIDNVYYLNLLFLVASVYLIFLIGNQLLQRKLLFSIIAVISYMSLGTFNGLSNISPDLLLTFLVLLTTYYILNGRNRTDLKFFIGVGVLFAIMSMTKGNIIFFILLYPFFLLIQLGLNKVYVKAVSIIFVSFIFSISPWMIYANTLRVHNSENSKLWYEKLIGSEKSCQIEIDDYDEIEKNRQHQVTIIEKNIHHKLVTHLWKEAYSKTKFIIISNQFRPEEFLSLHNEYCINGEWKPEWRFIENSYHNKYHVGKSPYSKIVHFYIDHPGLLFDISFMKLRNAVGEKLSVYCFSLLLIGAYLLFFKVPGRNRKTLILVVILLFFCLYFLGYSQIGILFSVLVFVLGILLYRKQHINFIHYSLILLPLNSFIFTIMIYGGERFIYFIDPISIITSLMLIERIFLDHNSSNIIDS